MTKKIFRSTFLASLIVLLVSMVLIFGALYEYMTNVSEQHLKTELELTAQGLSADGKTYLQNVSSDDMRITWIGKDGTVLYDSSDSDTEQMENHLQREEVQQALKSGYGQSKRYSTTLMERFLYAAQRMDDGTVLRLAITQHSIWSLILGMLQPIVLVLILAIVLSLLLSVRVSKRVVQPLNDLDLDHPLENEGFDELAPLFRRINSQQKELARQEESLSRKQEELNTILDNMQEGMILLRHDNTILSMNSAVAEILDIRDRRANRNLLEVCRDMELAEMVGRAQKGKADEKILSFGRKSYQVSVTPVKDQSGETEGVTIVFFDVTEKEMAERMRREFTANVSHELKTPLHSISGYAELLKDNVVRQEDIRPFSEKIYRESQRMIQMVEDIISLSHLDDGAVELRLEDTDVNAVAQEAVDHLKPQAEGRHVTLSYTGEKAVMKAKPALIQEIVSNLCDNAIKYNREGGFVKVSLRRDERTGTAGRQSPDSVREGKSAIRNSETNGSTIVLTVEDNGIGIPKGDQERIFERFYRVDKSHSREIGGTGLGLSIVKHAVQIHHGKIRLESTPGKGTKITVIFPAAAGAEDV